MPEDSSSPRGAASKTWRRRLGVLAVMVLIALAGVGGLAVFAFDAFDGDASDGAGSGAEALRAVLEAILDGDPATAAEYLEPGELAALRDAGFDPLEELSALTSLADGTRIDALADPDPESIGIETPEPVEGGIQRLHFTLGSLTGSVDVAGLRAGSMLTDWLPLDWGSTDASGSPVPVVAVRRDGRWYISGWYSLVEHVRRLYRRPLPGPARRPVEVGAATPVEAFEIIVDAAMHLDARRLIGMLDPDETAALYDYSGMFLNRLETIADEVLDAREAEGWNWEIVEISTDVDVDSDGALGVVTPTLHLRGRGDVSSFELELAPDSVELARTVVDDRGGSATFELTAHRSGDCKASFNGYDSTSLVCSTVAENWSHPGLVFRRVGQRWYLSPTRTAGRGSQMYLGLLGLAGMVDAVGSITADIDGSIPFGLMDPAQQADQPLDLLSPALGTPDLFFVTTSAAEVNKELEQWLPPGFGLGLDFSRGVYAYYGDPAGGIAVVVLVTEDEQVARTAIGDLAGFGGTEYIEGFDRPVLSIAGFFGSPVLLAADGPALVIVGSLGGDESLEELSRLGEILALQLAG